MDNQESWEIPQLAEWNRHCTAESEPVASEEELRALAEDLRKYSPGLVNLLCALGPKNLPNPLRSLN